MALMIAFSTTASAQVKALFYHQSVGYGILEYGGLRTQLYNQTQNIKLWDHYYNYVGLSDADGVLQGRDYGYEALDIFNSGPYPAGLHRFWVENEWASAKDSVLTYDLIIMKSCYRNADILSDTERDQIITRYEEIIDEMHNYPDKKFILMGFPPKPERSTTASNALRSRQVMNYLETADGGNVLFYNLFDLLAYPTTNFLKAEYTSGDNHPNTFGFQTAAIDFAPVIVSFAGGISGVPIDYPELTTFSKVKVLFR